MANFTFIDLFAGIGGFRLALESVGGCCIGFSEIAPDAIDTYCKNFNEPTYFNFGDITKLNDLPEHDLMTAGVPCQSWSIAGKNLGFDDDRGQLWNDTLFLLNKARPKAFIFENVKGLADPRNKEALNYIMQRVEEAGYYAQKFVLNAYDYGVPRTRVRIYIVGFREKKYLERLNLPETFPGKVQLNDVLDDAEIVEHSHAAGKRARWSLSCNDQGVNDYFLFNDLRNGATTIHSWDIQETTERQKNICNLLLRNRRKSDYGLLDGNPLSLSQFQSIDCSISQEELDELVDMGILKRVAYLYKIINHQKELTEDEALIMSLCDDQILNYDCLKVNREIKRNRINVVSILKCLEEKNVVRCIEVRYDFKNTRISTGLAGVNRIFLPTSKIYPTLVASDTNDFVTTVQLETDGIDNETFKELFLKKVFWPRHFRKITKREACRIQGLPDDFYLPPTRQRWMKLIGNSVAVPVVKVLANAIVDTGVFADNKRNLDKEIIEIRNMIQSHFKAQMFSETRHPSLFTKAASI